MQLSNEDNLRMNVLLAQQLKAIRINEGSMTVHALTEMGEAKVVLNPTARDDQYLRWIREMISMKVTGSPGGYPIFLKRWTRMGQANNTVEHMLLLGEPEAIVALVHGPTITHDIGVSAWWANPTTEVARRLLNYPDIIKGPLGAELSAYLLEFLPFEEKQLNVVESVRLCLQGNLTTTEEKQQLWKRAKRKNPYFIGFAHSYGNVPADINDHRLYDSIVKMENLINVHQVNRFSRILSKDAQNWLYAVKQSLLKPVDQDVVISLFIAIENQFSIVWPEQHGVRDIKLAIERADEICNKSSDIVPHEDIQKLVRSLGDLSLDKLKSWLILSQLGEDTLILVLGGNDAVGSVMRKRLLPLTTVIVTQIDNLLT